MSDIIEKTALVNYKLNNLIRSHFKDNFDEIRKIKTPYGEIGQIMYHIFDSHNFWINQLMNDNYELKDYFDLNTEKEFFDEWIKVDKRFIGFTETNTEKVNYKKEINVIFAPGEELMMTIDNIIMHMSHHSFYHRGTLGAVIRMNNLPPLPNSTWSFRDTKQ